MNGEMTPKVTTVKYLAEFFNVNPIWLMGYDVPMKNEIQSDNSNAFPIPDTPIEVQIYNPKNISIEIIGKVISYLGDV